MPDSPRNFSRYPMLWLSVCFASGIALSCFTQLGMLPAFVAGIILIGVAVLIPRSAAFALPLAFVSLGAICHQLEISSVAPDRIKQLYADDRLRSGTPVELEAVLLGLPEPGFAGEFLTVRVDKLAFADSEQAASGRVRLFAPFYDSRTEIEYDQLGLEHGSRVRIACRLEREERFRNPGGASRIAVLDQQGIDATGTIKSPLLIEKIGDESVFLPLAWVYEQRRWAIDAFRDNFSPRTAGVMIASLLGDKHFLDRGTAEVFRDGGTFHVLVISGLHITFIGGLSLWFVSFFTPRRIWQAVAVALFLWAYTLAVGAEVPVVRASLMFSFLLLSLVIYRPGSLINALGTCTLILLVWRPSDLFSASFQLTVVSVAAIVVCAFPLIEKLRAIGGWMPTAETPLPPNVPRAVRRSCEFLYWNDAAWRIENSRQIWSANLFKSPYLKWLRAPNAQSLAAYVFEGILVSLIVQIGMLPLLVVYFHRVTPASILLNLWVGVFLALESMTAVVAIVLNGLIGWLAAPLIVLTEFLNAAMMSVPSWFSDSDLAGIRIPVYSGPGKAIYFLYALGVAVACTAVFHWDPFALRAGSVRWWVTGLISIAVPTVLGLAIVFHPFSAPSPDRLLRVDFLDVGQGDSALITFPNGETMLVDGGGRQAFRDDDETDFEPDLPRIGEAVVSEFLWEKGYSRIDYLVATHADADHIQGLSDVAENFEVGALMISQYPTDDPDLARLLEVVNRRVIALTSVGRGNSMTIGGATVTFLNPADEGPPGSINNGSIVMRVAYGSRSFLLTGDIERDAESELLHQPLVLQADVVKVPHHGSRTSSTLEFVNAVDARFAVVPVGRRSRYGHPHPEVVMRWQNAGATVLTTGENGTITMTTDGEGLRTQTFVP